MRKVLFLMISLLLMGLGAANVKAQVRIGGNTAPSAAAVLDLNASDAANIATGGLVLPRVDLTSSTKQLTPGVVNQTGTMVYNVTTTLGRIGVYYWNGNSWVLASLPSTSAGDSGLYLMSNGSTWVVANKKVTVTWTIVTDTTITAAYAPMTLTSHPAPGVMGGDLCLCGKDVVTVVHGYDNAIYVANYWNATQGAIPRRFVCYRPSIN